MNPAADVWAKVLTLMQPEMTATTINTWFDDATAVALEDDRFVLYSPTRFKRDIIATRYVSKIQNAAGAVLRGHGSGGSDGGGAESVPTAHPKK